MYVEHRLELTAICPVDKKPDVYECVVEAARVVPVEDILRHAKELAALDCLERENRRRLEAL